MKKIIFILLLVVSIVSFSQTSFQCTKTIDTSNCKLRFFNANSVKIFELNLATTTYTRGVTNEYIIKDGLTQVTIPNNGCLTTPTFANLASFIDGARFTCSGTSSDSQSLHLAFSDSIQLSITRGNSIKFAYAIDSVSFITDSLIVFKGGVRKSYVKNTVSFAKNTAKDSIILTLNGNRYAVKDSIGSGGGSSSLSSLTSATATNTINNGAYSQEWQWNSQTNAPMLKLSSTSTGALTGGNGLEINLTGDLVNNNQTTYAAKFINSRNSSSITSGGAYFQGMPAIQTMGDISIGGNKSLRWNNGNNDGSYISSKSNTPQFFFNAIGLFYFKSSSLLGSIFSTVDSRVEVAIGLQSATRSSISFGGDNGNANGTHYRSESATSCIIERNLGKLLFSTNVGLAGNYSNFTPTYQICVDGTNNNVAIGKGNTAGDASAKLEVVSTTQGFLPPRMTATQASAIVSPAKSLIVYVTDTNGTFTSAGIWIYTTSWKLILAE